MVEAYRQDDRVAAVTVSKKKMHRQYGNTDVEHLARDLYVCFHQKDWAWPLYEKAESDAVVQQFRGYALLVARQAQHDADYHGMGSHLYRDES